MEDEEYESIDPEIEQFLADICTAFPEIGPLMAPLEPYMLTAKMEAFANATTAAFAKGELKRGLAYLNFMSARLDPKKRREFEYIDVYYVENLFWPHGCLGAQRGWPLIPANLRTLYLGFHGRPPFPA